MKPYGRKPQHPKGYNTGRIPKGCVAWWEVEGAQPDKGSERMKTRDGLKDIKEIGEDHV